MLNIVIPMAGHGSRFAKEGFSLPKPLIDVKGKPMIQRVVENLTPSCPHRFVFICQKLHVEKYNIDAFLKSIAPGSQIVTTDGVTQGAACTVLLAKEIINSSEPMMIANSDQYVDTNIDNYLAALNDDNLDGLIMTMTANDPKWSFVRFDSEGEIIEVIEKEVVSNEATVGIYNYAHGCDFVSSAEAMIADDVRVNGEFYVAPAYNWMIRAGKKIGCYNIGSEACGMYGLGIPADLNFFLQHPVSMKLK